MELEDFTVGFFEKKFRGEEDVKVRERLQILWYLRRGYKQREVSALLGVSVGIVPFWKARFEKKGLGGLVDKEGRGRKASLGDEQLSMLGSAIDYGVLLDDGYRRGFKTKDIADFIAQQFGMKYTARHCRRIMKWVGCSLKVPRPRNKSRNEKDVNSFKRQFKKNMKVWTMR